VRRLYQEVEEETIKLTNLRRETPQNLKKRYEESFNRSFEQIESLHREIETLEEDTDDERELRFMRLRPRLEHMSQEYSQSIRDIKYIKDVCIVSHLPSIYTNDQ
jgi:kinetochor protein Mis14/NSL1